MASKKKVGKKKTRRSWTDADYQKVQALVDGGMLIKDASRKIGIHESNFYIWRRKKHGNPYPSRMKVHDHNPGRTIRGAGGQRYAFPPITGTGPEILRKLKAIESLVRG